MDTGVALFQCEYHVEISKSYEGVFMMEKLRQCRARVWNPLARILLVAEILLCLCLSNAFAAQGNAVTDWENDITN